MTILSIYDESGTKEEQTTTDFNTICDTLQEHSVLFERWEANAKLTAESTPEQIIAAYKSSVDRLKDTFNIKSIDVVSIHPAHPEKEAMRAKFLDEHAHSDFEIRFFVEGSGLFYIHTEKKVLMLLCEKGDLLSIPGNMLHWFDMGKNPSFKCIRLFTIPDGWVAKFSESGISKKFPDFDTFIAKHQ